MKQSDLPLPLSHVDLPWLWYDRDYKGLQPLFHSGYYDGPLSGVVYHPGKGAFFYVKCHDPENRGLWYGYLLTPDDIQAIFHRHNVFSRYVGTHTEYYWDDKYDGWTRIVGGVTGSPPEWKKHFYENDTLPKFPSFEERDIDVLLTNPFR